MRIDDIAIEKSAVMPGSYILRIESGGYKATLQFENNVLHFAQASADALKFFGQAQGLIKHVGDGKFVKTER